MKLKFEDICEYYKNIINDIINKRDKFDSNFYSEYMFIEVGNFPALNAFIREDEYGLLSTGMILAGARYITSGMGDINGMFEYILREITGEDRNY